MKKLIPIILSSFLVFSYGASNQIESYANGDKKSEGLLKGLFWKYKSGRWIYYYPNGHIKERGNYKGIFGSQNGKWEFYYESGTKWKELNYKRGKNVGIQKEWYENGGIKEEWNLINHDKKDGKWISYYENGQIKKEGFYKNGWKNGLWSEWYENGQKRVECTHKGTIVNPETGRSVHDGKYIVWTQDGQIIKEGNYRDGVKDWENVYIESK